MTISSKRVPQEFLDKIKAAVNIIEVIGEHVVLKKSGSNHSGLCPFHSERTPSFSVSENKQLYHCYGCKKSGDLFRFVMDLHGIGFREAIEELADRARLPLPKGWDRSDEQGGDAETQKRREEARDKLATAHKLNRFAAAFYHQHLSLAPEAQKYLERRGCTPELLRNFYVGAAPAAWDGLALKLTASKAPLPLAVELGLIRPSQKTGAQAGSGYFDLFRNRVMFPILDLRGKVVGFGGRALAGNSPGEGDQGPKYLNSSDSFLFQKSKLAFGLYQAQKHIREKNEIILVEGYFDVLALHAAGFEHAVATCGTALTPDHLQLFRKFASRIVLLFDGDKAGIAATERAMILGMEHGVILHGAVMPEGLDPDEILFDQSTGQPTPEGGSRMKAILAEAKPVLDSRIEQAIQHAALSPEHRAQSVKQIGAWLALYQDPVGREVRLQVAEKGLGVPRHLLEKGLEKRAPVGKPGGTPTPVVKQQPQSSPAPRIRPAPKPATTTPSTPSKGPKRPSKGETRLLKGIALGGEYGRLFTEAGSNLPPGTALADLFEYLPAKGFLLQLYRDTALQPGYTAALPALLQQAQDPQLRSILTEALVHSSAGDLPPGEPSKQVGEEGLPGNPAEHDFRTALDRAVERAWARFSQQIKAQIAEAEASKDAELQAKLMKEYLDVQRKMKEFSSFYEEA
ncbi:MAG: DNA primase [Bdellovibrionales bacterium GWB1_55_8]|nr:MAG: DNA primase [Bdellovibrionales bacterium GWB1_55_8]